MSQVLVECSILLLAAVSVESPFNYSFLINLVQNCIRVRFVPRSVHVDVEDIGHSG